MQSLLCFEASHVKEELGRTGFVPAAEMNGLLDPARAWIVPRDVAEGDERFLQVIPYCLIRRGDSFYAYRRKGSEERLHDLFSLGFGGHVDLEDMRHDGSPHLHVQDMISSCMMRELEEELQGPSNGYWKDFLGVIYDPSNEVGRVHLGLVYVLTITADDDVYGKEETGHLVEFDVDDLLSGTTGATLESWSTVALDAFREPARQAA